MEEHWITKGQLQGLLCLRIRDPAAMCPYLHKSEPSWLPGLDETKNALTLEKLALLMVDM